MGLVCRDWSHKCATNLCVKSCTARMIEDGENECVSWLMEKKIREGKTVKTGWCTRLSYEDAKSSKTISKPYHSQINCSCTKTCQDHIKRSLLSTANYMGCAGNRNRVSADVRLPTQTQDCILPRLTTTAQNVQMLDNNGRRKKRWTGLTRKCSFGHHRRLFLTNVQSSSSSLFKSIMCLRAYQ